MEISEYIYKGVVETYYKKTNRADATHAGRSRNKREESATYKTHPATSESADKLRNDI